MDEGVQSATSGRAITCLKSMDSWSWYCLWEHPMLSNSVRRSELPAGDQTNACEFANWVFLRPIAKGSLRGSDAQGSETDETRVSRLWSWWCSLLPHSVWNPLSLITPFRNPLVLVGYRPVYRSYLHQQILLSCLEIAEKNGTFLVQMIEVVVVHF